MAQINKPDEYFNTVLYTGTAGGQTISGVGHQPDFIWVKQRGDAGYDHSLHDSVRGTLKKLKSNSSGAEITTTDSITSTNSDGFVLGADTSGPSGNEVNQDTKQYVAWNWLGANGTASNTDGSITSTVSANTTSGFSIVSYTGTGANATVGHGLGSALDFIIVKKRNGAASWCTTGTANGWDQCLFLDTTDQSGSYTFWQNTAPTSSVFSIDGSSAVNGSSDTFIAYCFAEKKGFSKFGSYTGNGNADGTFVYTGFKPAFVILKNTNAVQDWSMKDNKRPGYNVTDDILYPNGNYAEGSGGDIDILSNGFKARTTADNTNQSGSTFIYMAFAESPLVGTNNIPATAR